jgi:DNA-binding transcriptional LysR family regulator
MDIELLRTFLEVQRTGHFGRTADNLFLTQSTVSARIRQLEETLGEQLLERQRNNIRLTSAGQRLVTHAENIIAIWRRARQEVGLQEPMLASLGIAALSDIWDLALLDWLQALRQQQPDVALDTCAIPTSLILQQVNDGQQDIGFVFEPQLGKDLDHRVVTRTQLQLYSTLAGLDASTVFDSAYIMVDWGTAYAFTHAREYPRVRPNLLMSQGRQALDFMLKNGGAAYLPQSLVTLELSAGRLFAVEGTVIIERELHAIWRSDNAKTEIIEKALTLFPDSSKILPGCA